MPVSQVMFTWTLWPAGTVTLFVGHRGNVDPVSTTMV
jgi:hypothetical protein